MRVLLLVPLLLALGCTHWDFGPRKRFDRRHRLDRAHDPGETDLVLNLGGLVGGGATFGGPADAHPSALAGLEATVLAGWSDTTHNHGGGGPYQVYPDEGFGVTAGWIPGRSGGAITYAEVEYSHSGKLAPSGVAAGWAWLAGGGSGPQVTAFTGPLFLRASRIPDEGNTIVIGLHLKLPVLGWAWANRAGTPTLDVPPPPDWVTEGTGLRNVGGVRVFVAVGEVSNVTVLSLSLRVARDRARVTLKDVLDGFAAAVARAQAAEPGRTGPPADFRIAAGDPEIADSYLDEDSMRSVRLDFPLSAFLEASARRTDLAADDLAFLRDRAAAVFDAKRGR